MRRIDTFWMGAARLDDDATSSPILRFAALVARAFIVAPTGLDGCKGVYVSEYWTVGEFARHAGVTVRTIQYYDQQGLLSPSAKGPQNRRLYSEDNERDLNKILALKYLGNSLADIRDIFSRESDLSGDEVVALIDGQMACVERDLHLLLNRIAVLREARRSVREAHSVDWNALSDEMRRGSTEEPLSWRLSCVVGGCEQDVQGRDASDRQRSVAQWHELIAEVVSLMALGVLPTDRRVQAVAARYRELVETHGSSRASDFILMQNIGSTTYGCESFDELRQAVVAYLDAAAGTGPAEE